MDNKNNTHVTVNGGLTFGSLLTVVLIALKLCKVIALSWVWVFAPLWIPLALWLLFVIICLVILAIASK